MKEHWITSIIDEGYTRNEIGAKPYMITMGLDREYFSDAEVWTVATNGRIIVAVRGGVEGVGPATLAIEKQFLTHLTPPSAEAIEVPWPPLREWFGVEGLPQSCDNCHGKKRWPCPACLDHTGSCSNDWCSGGYLECSQCEGDGTLAVKPRIGLLGKDCFVDRDLLGECGPHLQAETVKLWLPAGKARESVFILAPDWRIVLMPIRPGHGVAESLAEADVFALPMDAALEEEVAPCPSP